MEPCARRYVQTETQGAVIFLAHAKQQRSRSLTPPVRHGGLRRGSGWFLVGEADAFANGPTRLLMQRT